MNGAVGLKKLMTRAGARSQEEFAGKLGYARASSIQRYLSEEDFGDKPLPLKIVGKLLENIAGKGCPPVTEEEILSLCGISALTRTEEGRNIVSQSAAVFTGKYIPVLSIGDAMNFKVDKDEDAVTPVEWVLSDGPLDGDEQAIRISDGSMSPTYPKGALAIIKYGAQIPPGKLAFLKVTHADGTEVGEIRRYKLLGYGEDGSKIEQFTALAHDDGYPDYKGGGPDVSPRVEIKGRVIRVLVSIEC